MSILDSNIEEEIDKRVVFDGLLKKPHLEWGGFSLNDLVTSSHNITLINNPDEPLVVIRADFEYLKRFVFSWSMRHWDDWMNMMKMRDPYIGTKSLCDRPSDYDWNNIIAQEIWNNYTIPYWKSREQRKNGESNFKEAARQICFVI